MQWQRHTLWMVLLALLIVAFVPPLVNVNRFRTRLADSASRSLGRDVRVGNVSIRLLPRPGFDVSDFVVEDDPAFSAEPMLTSSEVTADLRLASLWRGRFEIAKLSLKEPSVNLVRNAEGHWNFEALLAHASQVQVAPSTKRTAEPRPRFPYIEAESGRVNVKLVERKLPFTFVDADFALWLESEDKWHARLEGTPIRTDAHLGDTGVLKLDLLAERAEHLAETPIELHFDWRDAQLGQLTQLLTGVDHGWRGGVSASGLAKGTLRELALNVSASVEDFRRYDISTVSRVRLAAQCQGALHSAAVRSLELRCESAAGGGRIIVVGNTQIKQQPDYDASITVTEVPAASLAALVHVSKRNLPEDLTAEGTLDASLHLSRDQAASHAEGEAQIAGLAISSAALKTRAIFTPIHLTYAHAGPHTVKSSRSARLEQSAPAPAMLLSAPFHVSIDAAPPLDGSASINGSGIDLHFAGNTQLQTLLAAAQLAGVKPPKLNASGTAKIDLTVSGVWAGFAPPITNGTAQVADVVTRIEGVASPVAISNARLTLDRQTFRLDQIAAKVGDQAIYGSVSLNRDCSRTCGLTFALDTPQLEFSALNVELNPRLRPRGWFQNMKQLFGGTAPEDKLLALQGKGTLHAARFIAGRLLLTNVSANVVLDAGKLQVNDVRAQTLGGAYNGAVTADFNAPPQLAISGNLQHASAAELARLTGDAWGAGLINCNFTIEAGGETALALRNSATGHIDFDWRSGIFDLLDADGQKQATRFSRWRGSAHLLNGELLLDSGHMASSHREISTTGLVTADRRVLLQLDSPSGNKQLKGTLLPMPATPAAEASKSTAAR